MITIVFRIVIPSLSNTIAALDEDSTLVSSEKCQQFCASTTLLHGDGIDLTATKGDRFIFCAEGWEEVVPTTAWKQEVEQRRSSCREGYDIWKYAEASRRSLTANMSMVSDNRTTTKDFQ